MDVINLIHSFGVNAGLSIKPNTPAEVVEPFLEDLKNIYDINILHEEVQWENPDKIQKMHYQHVDTNKNKK